MGRPATIKPTFAWAVVSQTAGTILTVCHDKPDAELTCQLWREADIDHARYAVRRVRVEVCDG